MIFDDRAVLVLAIAGWWCSSSLCQIQSKVARLEVGIPVEALIFSQLACGAVLHLLRRSLPASVEEGRPTQGHQSGAATAVERHKAYDRVHARAAPSMSMRFIRIRKRILRHCHAGCFPPSICRMPSPWCAHV